MTNMLIAGFALVLSVMAFSACKNDQSNDFVINVTEDQPGEGHSHEGANKEAGHSH